MITGLTALIIQSRGDDIVCDVGGPSTTNRKYAGWINLYCDGEYDHALLSTEAIYDTPEQAVAAMKDIVTQVRGHEKNV